MLIDVNTYVGHWPFRQLRNNNTASLLRNLDRCNIDRAIVANLNAVFYRYVQPANKEMARQARRFRDRLIPFATINPTYAGWEEDLRRCSQDLELCGLRLYPQYHGYNLADNPALELIDAASELGWCLQIPMRIEDRRTRHPFDTAVDLSPKTLANIAEKRPKSRWMFLNCLGLDPNALQPRAQVLVDISRLTAVLQRNIQQFVEVAGPAHLTFGTGMPMKIPEPALLKLEVLDAPQRVVEGIAWRNAFRMLGMEP